ncbi:MAG: hypothetical protein KGJ66_07150 [Alphaproteobacteria bacterium]|nr:hypothetical protein [Alphaproteobacteria bacterium]
MADEIEFYSEPARPLVWFVRLKSVSTGLQTPVALGNGTPGTRGAVQASVHTEEAPLYETAFWAAFAKPLPEEGAQRYLKITYPFRFDHFRPDATIPDGYVRVDDRYIAPEGLMHGDSRTKFILTQISAWLQDNDLSPESFLRRQKPYVENSRGSQIIQILSSLEPDDLRRISIPADIWIRLLKS